MTESSPLDGETEDQGWKLDERPSGRNEFMTESRWQETTPLRVPDNGPGLDGPSRTATSGRCVWPFVMLVLSAAVCLPGCSVWQLAHRTMYGELRDYPQVTDGKLACRQYQRWAKDEWQRVVQQSGGRFSSDYGSGFIQGFADQVYAGGRAQAPALPPRKYWRVGYRNERGERAVEDWYAGFRHGARVAREGGYRDQSVIPSSLRSAYLDEAEPEFAAEPDTEVMEERELLEPTLAEPIPAPKDAEAAPPIPAPGPAEPILLEPAIEQLDDSASRSTPEESLAPRLAAQPAAGGGSALDHRTREDEPVHTAIQPNPVPPRNEPTASDAEDPEGPPIPPWHKPKLAGPEPPDEVGTGAVVPASFDPFGGTPFQETLGLHPAESAAPALRQRSERSAPVVPKESSTPTEAAGTPHSTGPRFTEAADPMNDAWQPPPPPPSTWKSRN